MKQLIALVLLSTSTSYGSYLACNSSGQFNESSWMSQTSIYHDQAGRLQVQRATGAQNEGAPFDDLLDVVGSFQNPHNLLSVQQVRGLSQISGRVQLDRSANQSGLKSNQVRMTVRAQKLQSTQDLICQLK